MSDSIAHNLIYGEMNAIAIFNKNSLKNRQQGAMLVSVFASRNH